MKTLITAAAVALMATAATARDNVQIAGSSTVLPYASIVAEAFGENFNFPTPVVESGGSGAGQKRLCEGTGTNTIDIANSSSIMKPETAKLCKETIGDFAEVRIGYDGIVFAAQHSNKGFDELTEEQLYHALKADSPYTNWSQIDPSLPNTEILVFLPGTKHGTREVFEKKVMISGCKAAGEFDKSLDKKAAERKCYEVRKDGRSVDIDGDYTETLASMEANKDGIGVFGLSFLLNNTESIYAATISGVEASTETIASGEYPISRPLQFYVKLAHLDVIPGMREYIEFFVSDEIAGPDGPLAEYGLVSDPELAKTQEMVANFK
jgi:phosphate transport system substrate-binding protein